MSCMLAIHEVFLEMSSGGRSLNIGFTYGGYSNYRITWPGQEELYKPGVLRKHDSGWAAGVFISSKLTRTWPKQEFS